MINVILIMLCNEKSESPFGVNSSWMSLQESDVLSLGLSSHRSWWKDNGPRCDSDDLLTSGWQKQENPELTTVLSCWLQYQYIEILHCIVQIVIAVSRTQPE